MQSVTIEQAFADLFEWSRRRDFAGHDPFDALNSRVFAATPLKGFPGARLAWTQLVKRSPVNLRSASAVSPGKNPKGIALFALAALANHRRVATRDSEANCRTLLSELIKLQSTESSSAAWGYNFDWQSRHFYAPQGTPMVVPTAFAVRALLEAYEALGDEEYLKLARSACDLVLNELRRTVDRGQEICFSYSPLDNTCVFNASLLAAEILATVSQKTDERELENVATAAARYVVGKQRRNGSWVYGEGESQRWVDNFHTAYVLLSLKKISDSTSQPGEFQDSLQRGYVFWRDSFFLADGWPKYYDDTPYPGEAHAAAAAIVTLVKLRELDGGALPLAERIAEWTLRNLRDASGYFYYQRRRFHTIRTPFMRWSQAWMAYALSTLLEAKNK